MEPNDASSNPRNWTIRPADQQDTHALTRLCEQLGYPVKSRQVEQQLTLILTLDHHAVLVAESEHGEIMGWVHIFERPLLMQASGAELGGLVVDERFRKCGVGRGLMHEAETWARERRLMLLTLRSNTQRTGAHAFYRAIGYDLIKTSNTFRKAI